MFEKTPMSASLSSYTKVYKNKKLEKIEKKEEKKA